MTFLGQKVKHLAIPEGDLVDGVFEADMQNVPVAKHGMQCDLNQECGFSDTGTCQNRPESTCRQTVVSGQPQQMKRISQKKVFFQHGQRPFSNGNDPPGGFLEPTRGFSKGIAAWGWRPIQGKANDA
jgi:hypothetical protein